LPGHGKLTRILDALDARLSQLGAVLSSLVLTALAVGAAVTVHFLIRSLEGQPVRQLSVFNITIEMTAVALPIIFYARRVIAELKQSRRRLQDMTRRLEVAAEEAHAANRAKSTFLANMSHELRTPLNAILGFSEIMKDQHLGPVHNPRYLSYSKDIHASGRYLLGIINDILDLSKIESGKMSLDSAAEFALRPTLEASLALVSGLAGKFDVTVTADLPDGDVRLTAVERMVRQIVINLVGNAIKFTPAGGRVHGLRRPARRKLPRDGARQRRGDAARRHRPGADALRPGRQYDERQACRHRAGIAPGQGDDGIA
jgi:signal transduction histidine kinase